MLSRSAFIRHGTLAATLGILAPGAASAHAMLHSSDPADGAALDAGHGVGGAPAGGGLLGG